MEQLNQTILHGLDLPLGWLLLLPRDVSVFVFSLLTALLMTAVRRWFTDQHLLHRCANDLRQLRQLDRRAKQIADKPQRQRLRRTVAMIKQMQLPEDMKLLAVVIVPVAVLAIWGAERLDYRPPRVGEELIVRAYFPISSVGGVTHLIPVNGVEFVSSPIRIIQSDQQSPKAGMAEWSVRTTSATDELRLTIRHRNESVVHRVAVGRTTYLPPQMLHANERLTATEVLLKRYRPLNLNLTTESFGLPPWMFGYLVLTLLLVPSLKRMLRIA
ncbi:MAG: hypothetical protein FJ302_19275 [Planctomycetes bacterium]|nr:hypothetical protein [Planctomycetota bacterium]